MLEIKYLEGTITGLRTSDILGFKLSGCKSEEVLRIQHSETRWSGLSVILDRQDTVTQKVFDRTLLTLRQLK